MFVIGITGGLGSGKSTVAQIFRQKGVRVLDADKIAHGLLFPGTNSFRQIIKKFGTAILKDGHIDRSRLAGIVFADARKLKKLCSIIHPQVVKEVKAQIRSFRARKTRSFLMIDAPLLFEAGLDALCDHIIVVYASPKVQVARIQKRNHWTKHEILKRMNAQMSIKKKVVRADFVIDNQGNINQTKKGVEKIWQELKKLKK